MAAKVSAGLLMYRKMPTGPEVLLVHPGGPFFRKKDDGSWTIPKGELHENEEPLAGAIREFHEEIGLAPSAPLIPLGSIKQKGGKIVHAWAFEGDRDENLALPECSFEMEWPPRSGKLLKFPEINAWRFFSMDKARVKINPAQVALLERLENNLRSSA